MADRRSHNTHFVYIVTSSEDQVRHNRTETSFCFACEGCGVVHRTDLSSGVVGKGRALCKGP
jgi:hypothetical protein